MLPTFSIPDISQIPPIEAALSFMPINPNDFFEFNSDSEIPIPLSEILK